jgi:TatD DNase family protein
MVIDSHCHLADAAFAEDLPDVAARAKAAGVSAALCILSADEPDEVARSVTVAAVWPEVRFAAGVHPHRAAAAGGAPADVAVIARRTAEAVSAVALGEIGLDYHYDFAPRRTQQEVFAAQIALAGSLHLPVVIHTREAADDTFSLLEAATPPVTGVMHCFSGTRDEARRALDLGFYLSLSGILTFPKAGALRELAAFVPEDRLLVETDAPFLAPVPFRGRRNEPAWVTATLRTLAAARGTTDSDLADSIRRNFEQFIASGARQ